MTTKGLQLNGTIVPYNKCLVHLLKLTENDCHEYINNAWNKGRTGANDFYVPIFEDPGKGQEFLIGNEKVEDFENIAAVSKDNKNVRSPGPKFCMPKNRIFFQRFTFHTVLKVGKSQQSSQIFAVARWSDGLGTGQTLLLETQHY